MLDPIEPDVWPILGPQSAAHQWPILDPRWAHEGSGRTAAQAILLGAWNILVNVVSTNQWFGFGNRIQHVKLIRAAAVLGCSSARGLIQLILLVMLLYGGLMFTLRLLCECCT
jgi:hypothetical protein